MLSASYLIFEKMLNVQLLFILLTVTTVTCSLSHKYMTLEINIMYLCEAGYQKLRIRNSLNENWLSYALHRFSPYC